MENKEEIESERKEWLSKLCTHVENGK